MDEVRFRNFLKHSANVSHAVLRSPVLTLQEKGLYSIICSYGWAGAAFPGQKRLAEENGVSERTIRRTIKRLVELKLLTVEDRRKQNKTNVYYIEFPDDAVMKILFPNGYEAEPPDTGDLRSEDHRTPVSSAHRTPVSGKELSVEETSDNHRRKRAKRIYDDDSTYMKMVRYFRKKIQEWKPDVKFKGDEQSWADEFRKIHELDGRSKEDIKAVIDWATSDPFWQPNILSPKKLREKFDTLQGQMNRKVIRLPDWEERKRQEEEVELKRLSERDRQIAVQKFIDAGFHPIKHKDLLEEWLNSGANPADLQKYKNVSNGE